MRAGDYIIDARVVSLNGNAASNSLHTYGLSFDQLNILQEYGLIISDYNSYMDYIPSVVDENNVVSVVLFYNNKKYALLPTDRDKYDKKMRMNGVALTKAGKELMDIIPIEKNVEYHKALISFLHTRFVQLIEVDSNTD